MISRPSAEPERPGRAPRGRVRRFLGVLAVVLALGVSVLAGMTWLEVHRDPALARAWEARAALEELRARGEGHPGARALRSAGCASAFVADVAAIARVVDAADPRASSRAPSASAPSTLVACSLAESEVACGELARAFVGALPSPPETFAMHVRGAEGERRCEGIYSQTGRAVRALHEGEGLGLPDAVTSASRRPRGP